MDKCAALSFTLQSLQAVGSAFLFLLCSFHGDENRGRAASGPADIHSDLSRQILELEMLTSANADVVLILIICSYDGKMFLILQIFTSEACWENVPFCELCRLTTLSYMVMKNKLYLK